MYEKYTLKKYLQSQFFFILNHETKVDWMTVHFTTRLILSFP